MALGFMDSQVLLTSAELGIFERLESPLAAEELAPVLGLPTESTRRLLSCLCALGLVRRDERGRYLNSATASEQLIPGRPGYIGGMFRYVREKLYPLWNHLPEGLREEASQWKRAFPAAAPTEEMYEDPAQLRSFMAGMYEISYGPSLEFASQCRELQGVSTIVDVGGGSGAFAIAIARHLPDACVMVLDLSAVQPLAEENFRRSGFGNLRFIPGDFWIDPLPAGADAYVFGFILHDWDDEGGGILLGKAAEASHPGTRLVIGEFLLNDDLTGPLFVARQSLNMLMSARGRERSSREYAEWMQSFGFRLESIYPTRGGKHYMVGVKM